MAAGRVQRTVSDWQRTKEIPKSEPQEAQARIQVQYVRRGEDTKAAGLHDTIDVTQYAAITFQMLNNLRRRHHVEAVIRVRQRLRVQIDDLQVLTEQAQQFSPVITGGALGTK